MMRLLAVACIAMFAVGCHAPTPSMNSMSLLAPYGSATVPPPKTGTVGTSGAYYAPPTAPPAAVGGAAAAQPGTIPPGAFMGASNVPTPATGSAVVPASYSAPAAAGAVPFPSAAPPAPNQPSSSLRLNGMHVNDATSAGQPPPPGPPVNLTTLPNATGPWQTR